MHRTIAINPTTLTPSATPATMQSVGNTAPSRWRILGCLTIILLLAAALRLHDLVSHAYMLDEDWSLEIATGRGSLHQHLPLDQIISPPPGFFSLNDAPPWWQIWSHMEVTHPPLYSLLLRFWEDLIGYSDYGGRLFAVIASLLAIAILFDTVRLQAGLAAACWAAILMTLSSPQVEHARLARSYTLLTAFALLCVNSVIRIEKFGMSPRRWILLCTSLLATLMTHYFCIGALIGLAAYAFITLPKTRTAIAAAFACAGLIFAAIWLPWMWRQRHLFATDDPSTLFLTADITHHTRDTLLRILLDPVRMIFPQSPTGLAAGIAIAVGAALYLLPLMPRLFRRNPATLLWGLWLIGTVAVIALLDFSRGTDHLLYPRYTILAGPAVFALIACLFTGKGRRFNFAMHLAGSLALIGCLCNLSDVYHHDDVDPRNIARDMSRLSPGPQDLLVFAAPPADTAKSEIELFMLARYLQPMTCKLAVITGPANASVMTAARHSRLIFLDTQSADGNFYLPGAGLIKARTYRNLGNLFVMQYTAEAGSSGVPSEPAWGHPCILKPHKPPPPFFEGAAAAARRSALFQ